MNFWREHLGQLLAGGGAGFGATFLIVFREMIRDTWNDYRTKKRDESRAALAALSRAPIQAAGASAGADRLGAEITHQLMALMTQELSDRKFAEEKNWSILKDLLETVKTLTNNVGSLQQQASSQTTLMQVIAARGR